MKTLIIFLTLSLQLFAQKQTLRMSNYVEPILKEFILDGQKRGLNLTDEILDKIDLIVFDEGLSRKIKDGKITLGLSIPSKKVILLNHIILRDQTKLRWTIYHEIGHMLSDSGFHSCDHCISIMSANRPRNLMYTYKDKEYEVLLDEFFNWLMFNRS